MSGQTTLHADDAARRPWDVLVIGAGPAGSVAACSLARAGWAVLLVDRSAMPRPKVCGCCLAPGGVRALRDAGLSSAIHDAVPGEYCTVRSGGAVARIPAAGYRVIGREVLDRRLAEGARGAGATLLLGWSARVREDGGVRLAHGGGASIGVPCFSAHPRVVVVADGLGGTALAERKEFRWRVSARSRMGVGAALSRSPVALASGEIALLCGREGYLGLVRLPNGGIDAAAALDPRAVREAGGPAELCARIAIGCGGDPDALRAAGWRGTPLLTRRRRSVESGNIFVIGDAAGYVEPFTGEGMTWAIEGAALAAGIVDGVLDGRPARGAWASAHAGHVRMARARCGAIARLARRPRVMRLAVTAASRWPKIGRATAAALGPPGVRASVSGGAPA